MEIHLIKVYLTEVSLKAQKPYLSKFSLNSTKKIKNNKILVFKNRTHLISY